MLEQPRKIIQERSGFMLALTSGILLTLYSALYQTIKHKIARVTILVMRGSMQVSAKEFL